MAKITISSELAAQYTEPDQAQRFERAVRKILSIPVARAEIIRGEASVNPNPRGRPRKSVVRAPGGQPRV
jgi:hypothetical protein